MIYVRLVFLYIIKCKLDDWSLGYYQFFSIINIKGITHNNIGSYQWEDKTVDDGVLSYLSRNYFQVSLSDSITLAVSRTVGKVRGTYMGLYLLNTQGLSHQTSGIIGKF